jgi:NADH-quinone oxidoreductase subunit C
MADDDVELPDDEAEGAGSALETEAEGADAGSAETEGADEAYGCPVTFSRGQRTIHPTRDQWLDVAGQLLADGWNMCIDVTSVDYSAYQAVRDLPAGIAGERFEVVVSFISHARRDRIRARIQVPADDPTIDSLYALYPGSDYLEREVYDLMGIGFEGHPDLSRILMPETWDGHPLRKDYAVGVIPVQFKAPSKTS